MRTSPYGYVSILAAVGAAVSSAVAGPATTVYWAQTFNESLRRVDVSGTNAGPVVSFPTVSDVTGVAVDSLGGKLYWLEARSLDDKLNRANLNGAAVESLILWPNVASPTGVAVDSVGGKLYWSEDDASTDSNDRIVRANLDGSGAMTILTWPVVVNPAALAVDPLAAKLYWIQRTTTDDKVVRSNLDGSGSETLVAWPAVADPTGIGVDPLGQKVYWSEASALDDRIVRANLDGTSVATVVSSPLVIAPVDLAVDPLAGIIFWAEDQTLDDRIARANLDGSNVQTVATFLEVTDPVALALDGTIADQPPVLTADNAGFSKNRFISFSVVGGAAIQSAIRVTFLDLPAPYSSWNDAHLWVSAPEDVCEAGGVGSGQPCPPGMSISTFASLRCTAECRSDWSRLGPIHVLHEGIVPGAAYRAEIIDCSTNMNDPGNFQSPLDLATSRFGDVTGVVVNGTWTAPNGTVDVTTDVVTVLGRFANRPGAIMKARADLEPACVDRKVNITDVTQTLEAFRSRPYSFAPSVGDPCLSSCP